jgi:hypothetical protein
MSIPVQFRSHPAECGTLRAELQQQSALGCSNRQINRQWRETGTYQKSNYQYKALYEVKKSGALLDLEPTTNGVSLSELAFLFDLTLTTPQVYQQRRNCICQKPILHKFCYNLLQSSAPLSNC